MITIINGKSKDFNLNACDMRDGRAYESESGRILIGNCADGRHTRISAFSVCGNSLARVDSDEKFREISLKIEVLELV